MAGRVSIERVPLAALTPAKWNPRTIRDERFKNLCRSIEADPDFLERRPVLAQGDGTIYAGNMRYRAVQHLGWLDVPAIMEDVPEQLAKERALRDNAQWGEWQADELASMVVDLKTLGSDVDLLGFEPVEIERMLASLNGDVVEDEVPPVPAEPITQPGDLWLLGEHRLLCGDSTNITDIERLMIGRRPTVLIADPPYGMNLDTDYSKMPKTTRGFAPIAGDHEAYDAGVLRALFSDIAEQFWFGADYYARSLGDTEHEGAWLVWDKRVDVAYDEGFGSVFEMVWSARKCKRRILRFQWFQNHAAEPSEAGAREHPTQKPSLLLCDLITGASQPSDLIFDPCLGSGSTVVAAERVGRLCYGLEIEPAYCDVVVRRWEALTGRTATRERAVATA